MQGAFVYAVSNLVKLVCLATFIQSSTNGLWDNVLSTASNVLDLVGLWFVFTRMKLGNLAQAQKFQV